MSSPFIAGVVALMQQTAKKFGGNYISNPTTLLNILRNTADNIVDSDVPDNGRISIFDPTLTVLPLPGNRADVQAGERAAGDAGREAVRAVGQRRNRRPE